MKTRVCISIIILITVLMTIAVPKQAAAADKLECIQAIVREDMISVYTEAPDTGIQQITGYIGFEKLQNIGHTTLGDSSIEVHTLILIDTSLSIHKSDIERFQDILTQIIDEKSENEKFSIATFGKQPKYLCDYTDDKEVLLPALASMEHMKQSSFLYQCIYDYVNETEEAENTCFNRLIIFSDGQDTNTEGVSKSEVYTLLTSHPYPIFTIGCKYDVNSEDLKDFFALSRITNASSITFAENVNDDEIKNTLNTMQSYLEIKFRTPETVMDGLVKNIELTVTTDTNTFLLKTDVRVGRNEEKSVPTEEFQPTKELLPTNAEPDNSVDGSQDLKSSGEEDLPKNNGLENDGNVEKSQSKDSTEKILRIISIVAVVLLVAVIFIIYLLVTKKVRKRKKLRNQEQRKVIPKTGRKSNQANQAPGNYSEPTSYTEEDGATQLLDDGATQLLSDEETELLGACGYAGKEIRLYDTEHQKQYSAVICDQFLIGRNREKCDLVPYDDTSMSQVHCRIIFEDGSLFIDDCNSSNHTYLNGTQVLHPTRLSTGDMILIGRTQLNIEL